MASSFVSAGLRFQLGGMTHVGRKRAHNEDSFLLQAEDRLAVVADGMGGHASGEVASRLAVETIGRYFRDSFDEPEVAWPYKMGRGVRAQQHRLSTAVKLANAHIWETSQKNAAQQGMGTTVVAALFFEEKVLVAHVGDSRVYRLRGGAFEQLTDDHSLINDYMKMKNLRADEVGNFPQKNVIVRALGMKESVQVDIVVEQARAGDVYVLCSDGLSGMVTDREIAQLASGDVDAAAGRLVDAANERGGVDNITVLIARVDAAA